MIRKGWDILSIKQKLLLMGTIMALLVAAICGIGYYTAQESLITSTAGEIEATLDKEAATVEGWLLDKQKQVQSGANCCGQAFL